MSGRIPRDFIDDLLLRVDIVDLIDSLVPLKKTGSNFVARCPFHTEKSPSFTVNRKKQFFYCFGCGAGGNAISFLMDFNHLDFVEAVEDLANFVGVDVPREKIAYSSAREKSDLGSVYQVLDQVAAFYADQLKSNQAGVKAVAYLKARGVSGETARDYMLGFAPEGWNALTEKFDRKALMDAGLLGSSDNGRVYDRFRGRLIFPIRDKRARVVGFGGRVLDDSMPKYLNSPETPVFLKGKEAYGLYELLKKNSKPERILIVEGYMDVIALSQYGIDYAVATLGTAASKAHLDLLFRFTSELVFCFDGDKAGRQAAWRAMDVVFSSVREGRSIRIMLLPKDHDPDSLVRDRGVEGFNQHLNSAKALSEYFFDYLVQENSLSDMEGRAKLVQEARPYLEKMPAGVFKDMMVSRLREMSGLTSLDVSENETTLNASNKIRQQKPKRSGVDKNRLSSARMAIALLLQNPELAELVEERKIDWAGLEFPGVEVFKRVLAVILSKGDVNTAVLTEAFRGCAEEKLIAALACMDLLVPVDGVETEFVGALDRLLEQARKNGIEQLLNKGKTQGLTSKEKDLLRTMLEKASIGAKN